jgi:hypothetical protein
MLRYRSAAFFGRIYAPELLMGLPSAEETRDVIDVTPQPNGSYAMEVATVDQDSGEITQPAAKTLPEYTDAQFTKDLPAWRGLIESGKKSAEDVIAMVSSKSRMSEDQMAMIRATSTEGATA